MVRKAGAGRGLEKLGRAGARSGSSSDGDSGGIAASSGHDLLTALHSRDVPSQAERDHTGLDAGIDEVVPHPLNPRETLGDLTELTDSVRQVGIIQPLTVASRTAIVDDTPELAAKIPPTSRWVVLAGHRRYAAAQQAGMERVPVIPREDLAPLVTTTTIFLAENLHREALSPVEEALGYARLRDRGMSQREIARTVGISQGQVSKRLALMELPEEVREAVAAGSLPVVDGLRLLELPDSERLPTYHRVRDGLNLSAAVGQALTAPHHHQRGVELDAADNAGGPHVGSQTDAGRDNGRTPAPAADSSGIIGAGAVNSQHAAAAAARAEACRILLGASLTPATTIDILTDALLGGFKPSPARAKSWVGDFVRPPSVRAAMASRRQSRRAAVVLAVSALEAEAARSQYADPDCTWPAPVARHVRRLVDVTGYELSEHEERKLAQSELPSSM